MALKTDSLKNGLKNLVHNWKKEFSNGLHKKAKNKM